MTEPADIQAMLALIEEINYEIATTPGNSQEINDKMSEAKKILEEVIKMMESRG